jgi:hypothetical protein
MTVNRLPTVGGDTGAWGTLLNAYLSEITTSVSASSQSGATYTLALTDGGQVVEFTNASAVTLTVPTNASVAFPVGTLIGVLQYGAGQVTISGAGVTFRSAGGQLRTNVQYSAVWLRKRATDEWVVSGDTAA